MSSSSSLQTCILCLESSSQPADGRRKEEVETSAFSLSLTLSPRQRREREGGREKTPLSDTHTQIYNTHIQTPDISAFQWKKCPRSVRFVKAFFSCRHVGAEQYFTASLAFGANSRCLGGFRCALPQRAILSLLHGGEIISVFLLAFSLSPRCVPPYLSITFVKWP